jgi:sugar transferase (PEP-CTERM/EpsH1 system associated)
LFLANRIPFPPHRGDKLKIYNLGRRLSKRHDITLLCFVESKEELKYRSQLEEIFQEVILVYQPKWNSYLQCLLHVFSSLPFQLAYFKSRRMAHALKQVLESSSFDAIHTQHLRMSQYTREVKIPKILDLPDAYSLYWERRKKSKRPLINRLFDTFESKRVVQYERVVNSYDLNLACSVEDLNHLKKKHPTATFDLLINGVDLDTFVYQGHDYKRNDVLLFTGNMDYAPNVDAVLYFKEELWPILSKKYPDLKFKIVGQRPIPKVQALADDRVEVTGFVPDISDAYREASVVIAPLRFGAGTQNKVIEAMAMGVPAVCTNIGFKGLQIESGQGVLHAPSSEDFIREVEYLLSSSEHRERIGQKGLEIARSRYSWDGVSGILERHLEGLID